MCDYFGGLSWSGGQEEQGPAPPVTKGRRETRLPGSFYKGTNPRQKAKGIHLVVISPWTLGFSHELLRNPGTHIIMVSSELILCKFPSKDRVFGCIGNVPALFVLLGREEEVIVRGNREEVSKHSSTHPYPVFPYLMVLFDGSICTVVKVGFCQHLLSI